MELFTQDWSNTILFERKKLMYIPKSLSHKEKVLYCLREFKDDGCHSFDLAKWISIRAVARIHDLKKAGHNIITQAEKRGNSVGVRYFLNE